MVATPTVQVYVNGVAAAHTDTVSPVAGTVDYNRGVETGILAIGAGTSKFSGQIGDFWFDNTFVDLSTNISKFYSAGPVFLGATGQLPTGSTPKIFFGDTMNAAAWNVGNGLGTITAWTWGASGAVADFP